MENFEPLVIDLCNAGGIIKLRDVKKLHENVLELLRDEGLVQRMCLAAEEVVSQHARAIEKSLDALCLCMDKVKK